MKTKKTKVKKSAKTASKKTAPFKITKELSLEIKKEAASIVGKSNIKKYEFPVQKVEKLLTALYKKTDGKFKLKDSYKFAAGYCDRNDKNYAVVNAIISLMKRHRPDEMVTTTLAKGRKVLIIGDVARELLEKSTIDWGESHVSSSIVKVPLKLPMNRKLKSFDNETIGDEIKRNENK